LKRPRESRSPWGHWQHRGVFPRAAFVYVASVEGEKTPRRNARKVNGKSFDDLWCFVPRMVMIDPTWKNSRIRSCFLLRIRRRRVSRFFPLFVSRDDDARRVGKAILPDFGSFGNRLNLARKPGEGGTHWGGWISLESAHGHIFCVSLPGHQSRRVRCGACITSQVV